MFTIAGPVILDLNTQRDLLAADGAFPVFQVEKLAEPLKKLFTFAHRNHIPVISTRLHTLTAPGPRDGSYRSMTPASAKILCDLNSPGYQKMNFTNLRRRKEFPLDCGTSLPVDGFRTVQQYVFDLPNLNLFECPRLDRLLSESTADLILIAGAPLEWTVRTAVLGLLARRHKVALLSDCLGMWDPYEGDMALRQIESKNVEWLNVEQVNDRFNLAAQQRASRAAARAARAQARPPIVSPLPMKTSKTDSARSASRNTRGGFRM